MSVWKGVRARLGSLRRGRAESRMEEEFRFHLAMETEANIERGMSAAEAARQARLAFGGADRFGERMRDGRGTRLLSDLLQDVRFALRGMTRAPAFAVVACITIGLGVGVTTALFSLTNALLLRPLPVADVHELFSVQEHRSGSVSTGIEGRRMPYSRYLEYRAALGTHFQAVAAQRLANVSLRLPQTDAWPASALLISANYFDVLRVQPQLGRLPTDDHEAVAVLSHRAWRERFGSASDVLGSTVHIDGRPFTVVGVAPPRFGGTTFGIIPDVWVPHGAYAAAATVSSHALWVAPFGRLAPQVTMRSARAAADAAGRRIPEEGSTVHRVELEAFTGLPGEGRRLAGQFMGLLLGAAGLVLLIASANIAGMLLARAFARRREIAVRLAIGAGRRRLVRQLLTESVVLFLFGGLVGVMLAFALTSLISSVSAPVPNMRITLSATPDLRVLAFALIISLVPAIVFGLLPALRSTRPDLVPALKEGAGGGRSGTRLRSAFVVSQLAMAVLLLVTAGLFTRTLQHGLAIDPGFEPDGVVVAATSLAQNGYDETRGRIFYDELRRRVAAHPGVESVSLASMLLLAGNNWSSDASPVDETDEARRTEASMNVVDEAYFATMRIPLLEGRGFTEADHADAERVAVINRTLARRFWGDESAVGRSLRIGADEYRVIGVTPEGRYVTFGEDPRAFVFLPFAQHYSGSMILHVRSQAGLSAVLPPIRASVRNLDPNVALEFTEPVSRIIRISLFPQRFAAVLVGGLGLLGLILAAVGTYGLLMYTVTQRSRDFGIRIALGASGADLTRGVLAHGLGLTAAGVVLGLGGAALLSRAMTGFIFGIGPHDPITYVAVPLILTATALTASYQPVRRALRADPIQTLRAD